MIYVLKLQINYKTLKLINSITFDMEKYTTKNILQKI
jgi:hypothetical protein